MNTIRHAIEVLITKGRELPMPQNTSGFTEIKDMFRAGFELSEDDASALVKALLHASEKQQWGAAEGAVLAVRLAPQPTAFPRVLN